MIVAALGLWTVIDRSFANELLGTNLYIGAAYVLVITGLLVIFISCFGCFGAIKEVRCMLVTVLSPSGVSPNITLSFSVLHRPFFNLRDDVNRGDLRLRVQGEG